MTLTLRAGQIGRFVVDMTSVTSTSAAPFGAVEVEGHGPIMMTTEADTGDLLVNPMPPGMHHFEVRSGKYTIADGHFEVLESPLEGYLGEMSWTVKAADAPELARFSINSPKGDTGKSAYEAAVEGGYQGTEEEWNAAMAGLTEARSAAAESAAEAKKSEEATATSAKAASEYEAAAAADMEEAGVQAEAAAASASEAAASKDAAATSETKTKESEEAAAASASEAKGSEEAAATSAKAASEYEAAAAADMEEAGVQAEAAAASASEAAASKDAAATSETKAKESEEAAAASASEAAASKEAAEAARDEFAGHLTDDERHLTVDERAYLDGFIPGFAVADPAVPEGALPNGAVRAYFALNAEEGVTQAPSRVFVSRVPWARWDGTQWLNNAPTVDETVFGVSRKLLDNEGLVHECSTDTVEGQDDYDGKWAFHWVRGNYIKGTNGVKYVTAIEGHAINGASFDPAKPVCTIGPIYWFFCKTELRMKEDGTYTTDDGTAEGVPLFQLWGLSSRPWGELDEGRREKLLELGITEEDFHICPSAQSWDDETGALVPRPYYCFAAYCGGYDATESGAAVFTSKPGLPLRNNLSHNGINSIYGNAPGMGGSADVNGHGMLFDITKNANKNSQAIHMGMSGNNNSAVLASQSTAEPGYLFPIASKGSFEVGCTVWLWQTAGSSAGGTTYVRSQTVQIGRIDAIETREITLSDDTTASSLCLVIDPSTVEPFIVRTGADSAEAIAATKELTDAGQYAACYATQGMALTGETDAVIGKHDGSRTSNTSGRHPYRVQGVEYMPGVWIVAADTVGLKGDDATAVMIDGVEVIPTSSQYIIMQAPCDVTRRTSGTIANFLSSGYVPIGVSIGTSGVYVTNVQLSSTCVAYPVGGGGSGSSSTTGHADYFWAGANPAEFLSGGTLGGGAGAGSASLSLYSALGTAYWSIGGRD